MVRNGLVLGDLELHAPISMSDGLADTQARWHADECSQIHRPDDKVTLLSYAHSLGYTILCSNPERLIILRALFCFCIFRPFFVFVFFSLKC